MNTVLGVMIDWVLALALWLEAILTPRLLSRTGYDNPRVRHVVGGLGYYARAYRITLLNVRRWLEGRTELFPAVLQVQTINRCNAHCSMCPYPYTIHLQEREIMDDVLYSKIVAECASETDLIDFVPMSKNEPLLDPKLEARIAEFKAIAAPHQMVELVTNGSALTPARFSRLAESGVDLITISMSAYTEAIYAKVMAGLSWRQVMKNLEALATTDTPKVNIFLRFIRQQDNVSELKAFTKRWRKFNILAFDINNRSGAVRNYGRMALTKNSFIRWFRRLLGRQVYPVCPYIFSIAHVLQNGDMPLCANDWHNREVLGNVKEQSIREIYNSPRMQEIRELMRQGRYEQIAPCRECSFWKDWLQQPEGGKQNERKLGVVTSVGK